MKKGFQSLYPYLHLYCIHQGSLEIGPDEYADSWVRILDEGGTREELDLDTLDESLAAAEDWAKAWMTEHYTKEVAKMLKP